MANLVDGGLTNINFRNDSGETIPPFAIMRCVGAILDNLKIVLLMKKPDETYRRFYYVNGPSEVKDGSHGSCGNGITAAVARLTDGEWEDIDDDHPEYDRSFGPKPNQWGLYKNLLGFNTIAYPENDVTDSKELVWQFSDDKALLVRQTEQNLIRATLDADWDSDTDDPIVCSVLDGTNTDSTFNVNATMADESLVASGRKYASMSKVVLQWYGGKWRIVAVLNCTVSS